MLPKRSSQLLYFGIWLLVVAGLTIILDEPVQQPKATSLAHLTSLPTAPVIPTIPIIPFPTHTPTLTPLPTAGPTLEPTLPVGITPRFTRTPVPTSIPTGLPVIELSAETEAYQLRSPEPQTLLDVLYTTLQGPLGTFSDSSDSPFYRQILADRETYALQTLVNHDLVTYYADGFPLSSQLLDLLGNQELYTIFPVIGVTTLLNEAVRDYFLQNNPPLTSGLPVELNGWVYTPYAIDLEGDSKPEWVIRADIWQFHTSLYLGFDQTESGTLLALTQERIIDFHHDYSDFQIHFEHDLTGDGNSELVSNNKAYIGGSATVNFITIITEQQGHLQVLEDIDISFYFDLDTAYDIADYTGDGLADIRVLTPHDENFNCAWDEVDIYSWNGLTRQPVLSDGLPPDTSWCNVWRGFGGVTTDPIFLNSEGTTLPEQISFLETALAQFAQEQSPPMELVALVQIRLAMLYSLDNRLDEAQVALESITVLPQDEPFVQIALENYEASNGSLLPFCRALLADANQVLDTGIGSYVNTALIRKNPTDYEPFLPFICPLRSMALYQFSRAVLDRDVSPVAAAANMGFDLAFYQQANLDDDPEWEGIGILEPADPTLVIFDPTEETWAFFSVGSYANPVTGLELAFRDLTNDAMPEVIVAVTLDISQDMEPDLANEHVIVVLQKVDEEFVARWPQYPDEKPNLSELEADFFGLVTDDMTGDTPTRPGPYWYFLENFPIATEAPQIADYVGDLQAAVLDQSRSQTVGAEILACLNYLPADDWDAQQLSFRLLFLLGYHYEQVGETDEAVTTYLSLIQQAPQSPWSWLAWARLEPGNF